jgi:cold shock CspA family protein
VIVKQQNRKWFNDFQSFAFITPDGASRKSKQRGFKLLRESHKVSTLRWGQKGKQAANIKPLQAPLFGWFEPDGPVMRATCVFLATERPLVSSSKDAMNGDTAIDDRFDRRELLLHLGDILEALNCLARTSSPDAPVAQLAQ